MDLVILLPAKSNCKRQQNTSFSAWHKLKQWHGIWCPQCAWVQVVLEPIKRLCNKKWIIHAVLETSPFVRHIEYKNVCQLQIDSSVERECIIFHTNSRYVIHDTLSCNGKHFLQPNICDTFLCTPFWKRSHYIRNIYVEHAGCIKYFST